MFLCMYINYILPDSGKIAMGIFVGVKHRVLFVVRKRNFDSVSAGGVSDGVCRYFCYGKNERRQKKADGACFCDIAADWQPVCVKIC